MFEGKICSYSRAFTTTGDEAFRARGRRKCGIVMHGVRIASRLRVGRDHGRCQRHLPGETFSRVGLHNALLLLRRGRVRWRV